jgi:hypothetical protein
MPLVGNLRDFALHDFLYLVDRGYKTGSLQLERPASQDAAHLFFDKGKLIAVIRPHRRERLGEMLIRLNKITPQQLAQALHTQQMGDNRPVGHILVDIGATTPNDLQNCIQQQIEETVYDLFAWRDGEFRFQAGQRPAADDVQSLVPLPVENLIMEGVRRVDEMSRIREQIPNNDLLVRFVDRPQEKAANINMTADEWRIFARINGRASINDIADKTGLTAFQVSHIIYGFITAGMVELQKPTASAQPVAAERRPPGANTPRATAREDADGPRRSLVSRLINRIRGL